MQKAGIGIDTNAVTVHHRMMILRKWHSVRLDLENQLFNLVEDCSILEGRNGTYKSDVFLGHYNDGGPVGYIKLSGKEESYTRFHELYGT